VECDLANQELVIYYMAIVKRMARKYRNTPLGRDDAEGVGCLALVEALRSYDPNFGVNLDYWVTHMVRCRMSGAARETHGTRTMNNQEVLENDDWWGANEQSTSDQHFNLYEALHRLEERIRLIVVLYMSGFHLVEIAVTLGVSESRVSQLLSKGRSQLEGYLVLISE